MCTRVFQWCSLQGMLDLNLSENEMRTIPIDVGSLSCLTKLKLQENLLSKMPAVIGNLTCLLSVDISENEFQYLPTEIGKWVKILRSDPHDPLHASTLDARLNRIPEHLIPGTPGSTRRGTLCGSCRTPPQHSTLNTQHSTLIPQPSTPNLAFRAEPSTPTLSLRQVQRGAELSAGAARHHRQLGRAHRP